MVNTVIFDMDGTLLDTLDDLTSAVNHAMEVLGYPARNREDVRNAMGNGLEVLIRKSLPLNYNETDITVAIKAFKSYYAVHGDDATKPYDGIQMLLTVLKQRGIKTAVLSNKYEAAVLELADEYFPGSFDVIRGERNGVARKPAPDSLFSIMEELAVTPDQVIYVGDSEVDMQTGINAGVTAVGVTWGFRSRKTLEENGADYLVDRPEQLLELL